MLVGIAPVNEFICLPNYAIKREEIGRFVCSTVAATSSSIKDRMLARSLAISFRMWDTHSTPFGVMRTIIFRSMEASDGVALWKQRIDETLENRIRMPALGGTQIELWSLQHGDLFLSDLLELFLIEIRNFSTVGNRSPVHFRKFF